MPDIKGFLTELSAISRKYGIEITVSDDYAHVRLDAIATGKNLGWCMERNESGAYQVDTDWGLIAGRVKATD